MSITKKTYVKDFLDGRQHKNTGEIEQWLFENHHDAIISADMFEAVQYKKTGNKILTNSNVPKHKKATSI